MYVSQSFHFVSLCSRKTYTKNDWEAMTAAFYYDSQSPPRPSSLSTTLFKGTFNWANATADRTPLSDWTYTDSLLAAGFKARPVYGAWWAPVLVAQGPELGLGRRDDPALQRARDVFQAVHDRGGKASE